jgi:serine/threonine protein kinase
MIGQNVGNYRIVQTLGKGGMGTVYLAEHPALGRRAAVKVLNPELTRNPEMTERFFNEARAANEIGHPGIVEVSDFGTLPSGEPYIVMEFLRGQSLAARMRAAGRLPVMVALDIAAQAADALGAAHSKNVVHRDLKPDNLFLVPDARMPGREQVKILDFGIAKLAQRLPGAGGSVTRTGTVMGTPQYMSPEQCRATRDVDQRSDIYSLGVIIYEMLAGQAPFSSDSWGELMHLHIGVEPPPLRSRQPDIAADLEAVVHKALAKDPALRFQSMDELRQALTGSAPSTLVLRGPDAPALSTPAPVSTLRLPENTARPVRSTTFAELASEVQTPTEPRRPRWVVPVAASGVAAAIAVAIALHASDRDERRSAGPVRLIQRVEGEERAAPPTPAAPAAPQTISIAISSTPAGALVVRERDGAVLGRTPLALSWPRSVGVESLRLDREGYRSETLLVALNRDGQSTIELHPIALSPPPTARQRPAARAAHIRTERPATPSTKPAGPTGKPVDPLKI